VWDPQFNEGRQVMLLSVIEDTLPDMLTVLQEDPVAADTAYLSVLEFGDKPEAVLKLTSLQQDLDLLFSVIECGPCGRRRG
jgi:uncharacterized protein YegL